MTATDCLELRGRLAEHAVSTLPDKERREVDRHLEWCAGCRKEARELQEGASIAGLSLPPLEPPAELQQRVVSRIQQAASAGRPRGTRSYVRRTVTILAAVVGLLGVSTAGILIANQQSAKNEAEASKQFAQQTLVKFRALLLDLRQSGQPSVIDQAVLKPTDGSGGIGGVLRVAPRTPKFAPELTVLVGGLDRAGAPYRVWLVGPHGRRFLIPGYMPLDNAGGGELKWTAGRSLSGYQTVEVRDAKGHLALSGSFRTAPARSP